MYLSRLSMKSLKLDMRRSKDLRVDESMLFTKLLISSCAPIKEWITFASKLPIIWLMPGTFCSELLSSLGSSLMRRSLRLGMQTMMHLNWSGDLLLRTFHISLGSGFGGD